MFSVSKRFIKLVQSCTSFFIVFKICYLIVSKFFWKSNKHQSILFYQLLLAIFFLSSWVWFVELVSKDKCICEKTPITSVKEFIHPLVHIPYSITLLWFNKSKANLQVRWCEGNIPDQPCKFLLRSCTLPLPLLLADHTKTPPKFNDILV